jgi:hypothetical protein
LASSEPRKKPLTSAEKVANGFDLRIASLKKEISDYLGVEKLSEIERKFLKLDSRSRKPQL